MMLTIALLCICLLLVLPAIAVAVGHSATGTTIIYGTSLVVLTISLAAALVQLLTAMAPASITLPIGLPWLGAHFRMDALCAFFLVVVNLGGAGASVFALGYGRHETAPMRVLPFY